ncbi:phospholipase A2 inhibitor and Ly6/PLAUR domain-containing protein-like [Eublepharis macularius]|uniref:Phospholipase A2 inhibitor and Ly6/PLAUR domain-containing protein-like n=1 Tax=Eublepharis macularius TaxID=481883 RepID=A0AA97LHQ0_EUBMA|nr:phospholipase A2 inhibitor and Ly6/PLAUR domain-containing protein-like [Eublepharis macularius]
MMRTSVTLFIFAVLLAVAKPGFAIQCRTCTGINLDCFGSLMNCASEYDICGSLFIEATLLGKTVTTTKRSCTTQKSCVPGDIFMHLANGYLETGSSICCTTDDCNAANLTVPARNETLNGIQCPYCVAEGSQTCKDETINCTGLETQCFTRQIGSITHKGCASKSFCANSQSIVITEKLYTVISSQWISCKAASEEQDVPGRASKVLQSTQIYLQIFVGFLIANSFFQCLF